MITIINNERNSTHITQGFAKTHMVVNLENLSLSSYKIQILANAFLIDNSQTFEVVLIDCLQHNAFANLDVSSK